ncbi:zinc ribbon domain-containing protein [Secundilactobacillus hailunensis]|uniref:Zinc ribbon domain-containing protein n=1 Tax=Secundilactobacillus hailunensis TaxID=2559923 RepID=A0ABW1T5N0_9LACO|nr:zinc ribbon domain-containing protein [Secundilactobacillus hailunensis]
MEKQFCVKCGKELPNEAEFCPYCGLKQPVLKKGSVTPEKQYERPTEVFYPQNNDTKINQNETGAKNIVTPSSETPKKEFHNEFKPYIPKKVKPKKPWYKHGLAIVLVAALFLFAFVLAKDAINGSSSTTEAAGSYDNSNSNDSTSDDSSSDDTEDSDDDSDYEDEDSDDDDTGDFTNDSVAGISASDYDATEAAGNTYSYGELLKSDDYNGESYNITNAEVLQADENDGATTLLVYTDEYVDEVFKIYYPDTTDAVKDDYVTVKGVLGDREEYDTQAGGSNTVPTIVAQDVSITGSE